MWVRGCIVKLNVLHLGLLPVLDKDYILKLCCRHIMFVITVQRNGMWRPKEMLINEISKAVKVQENTKTNHAGKILRINKIKSDT